jgi:putative glycerol-1-phosphate prenyltransferase
MITEVKNQINGPLFIGGGIRTEAQAIASCEAGADVVVIGNAFEKNPELIFSLTNAVHTLNK